MPQVMFRPVRFDSDIAPTVAGAIKCSFDDKESADLVFVIEGKNVHVHRTILKIRCQYFRSMLQSHWEEDNKSEIKISEFSYIVYRAFLQYVYTDGVYLPPHDAIGLLNLAEVYCEERLKRKCGDLIKQSISVENSASLMEAAIKYNAKDLEYFCFKFIVGHLTAVTRTIAFGKLDGETIKSFVVKAGEAGAFKQ